MSLQRHNHKVRLRGDSSWVRNSPVPSRPKQREFQHKPKGDVNDDEEIYEDGTSISNITVAGVKDKISMFTSGPKPSVSIKPVPAVLKRFQEKREEVEQTSTSGTFGKSGTSPEPAAASPGVRNFVKSGTSFQPSASSSGVRNFGKTGTFQPSASNPGGRNFGTPVVGGKVSGVPPAAALKPKSTSPGSEKSPQTNTDQNQNVTNISPYKKRSSVDIPNAFHSNSPASSASSPSSTGKKTEEKPSVLNGTLPKTTSPTSPASMDQDDEDSKPKIDFRANLRPTGTKGAGPPKAIEIHSRQRNPSQDDKVMPLPGSGGKVQRLSSGKIGPLSSSGQSASIPKRITPSRTVFTRITDGKKFERVAKSVIITQDLPPIKPLKPKNIKIKDIIDEYTRAFEDYRGDNEELYDDVGNFIRPEEEEYDDVGNTVDRRSSARKSTRPVSEIPVWTEEDEMESGGSASVSGGSAAVLSPTQEEMYDEGIPVDSEELYEPLPDEEMEGVNPEVDKKEQERREKEAVEKKKKEEKERKEQEKKEKQEKARKEKDEKAKLEKEKKEKEKKEKDEKKLKKDFKMTGEEQIEAQGVVSKAKTKGGKLELAVQSGEKLDIIRMTDNPKGKWLVRNKEGAYGYVDADNILIETPTIKQAMNLVDPQGDIGPEEMYEDLDEYQDNEEIYEECS